MATNTSLDSPRMAGRTRLRSSLKLWQVVMMGLAYLTPMTVFDTFGIVSGISNGHVPASYLLALAGVMFTAISYGKLVRQFPEAGSAYTYTQKSIGPHLGFMVGWSSLLDYLFLPMINVLLAKIQAILRRTYDFAAPAPTLEHRGAVLNTADASLTYQGQRIELTKNDYRILQTLLERKGSVVSRETLMEKLWETDSFVDENTLTVNIARLRRKLEAAGLPDYITTKKGLGYLIE